MSKTAQELASQPVCWARSATLAAEVGDVLPRPGERVLAVGCGTSLHMGESFAVLRESAGFGATDARAASEVVGERAYDRVVALSRSGTTTEVIRFLRTGGRKMLSAMGGEPEHAQHSRG